MTTPDVEAAFIALLPGSSTTVPEIMPTTFTRVSVIGGTRVNILQDRPSVLVEHWSHTSRLAASSGARAARDAVLAASHSASAGVWLGEVSASLPVEYPDPDHVDAWRFQFTATVTVA